MSTVAYAASLQTLLTLGGVFLLTGGSLWLVGGLTALFTANGGAAAFLLSHAVRVFGVLVLPWVLVLGTGRGFAATGTFVNFTGGALAAQAGLLFLGVLLLFGAVLQLRAGLGRRWVFEYFGAVLLLLLCWHAV